MNVGCELYLEWGFDGKIGFGFSSQLLGDELWPCGIHCFDKVLDNGALVDQVCGMAVVNDTEKEIVRRSVTAWHRSCLFSVGAYELRPMTRRIGDGGRIIRTHSISTRRGAGNISKPLV